MENQQNTQNAAPTLMSHALKHGIILGVISIILVVVCYVVAFSFMVTFKFIAIVLLICLGYVIYAGINYRNEIGGYMGYGQAFQHGILIMLVSGVLGTLFNLLLYNIVDPELGQKMTDAIIANTEEMMANFGAPQASIDQTIEGMRTEMPQQFTPVGQLIGFGKAIIGYVIIALITSLFVRKNVPVEA
ncbi:MAG: DUF4199 domain-containing protein [Cyclobacteriaceae bacterium]|nr:DUF4199 domain-containing protein [Cyclobacteriaceae bacterium]